MTISSFIVDLYGNIIVKSKLGGPDSTGPTLTDMGSAEYVGGGVFLTAAHLFDTYTQENREFKYSSAGLNDFSDKGGYTLMAPFISGGGQDRLS